MQIVQQLATRVMEQRKWPLKQIATEIGCSYDKLHRLMRGKSGRVDALLLVELFRLAGVSMDRTFKLVPKQRAEDSPSPETVEKAARLVGILGRLYEYLQIDEIAGTKIIEDQDVRRRRFADIGTAELDALRDAQKLIDDLAVDGEDAEEREA